jgi:hypothetical protein
MADRPAWTEVVGILAACAVLFVVIAKLDRAAADRAGERARAALAERAVKADTEAADRPVVEDNRPPAAIGDRGPISVPVGGAWSAGTAHEDGASATPGSSRNGSLAVFALAAFGAVLASAGALVLGRAR